MKLWHIEFRVMVFNVADECVMDSPEVQGFSFAEESFGVLVTASLVESVTHS